MRTLHEECVLPLGVLPRDAGEGERFGDGGESEAAGCSLGTVTLQWDLVGVFGASGAPGRGPCDESTNHAMEALVVVSARPRDALWAP